MKLNQQVRLKHPELFSPQEIEEIKKAKARQELRVVRLPDEKDIEMSTSKVNVRIRDMFSNIIMSGDYIAYPGRQGSDTYMRTAKVLSVNEEVDAYGDKDGYSLSVAVAMAPRWEERKTNPYAKTRIVKTKITEFHRATVLPKSYIQNDKRYRCLLEV